MRYACTMYIQLLKKVTESLCLYSCGPEEWRLVLVNFKEGGEGGIAFLGQVYFCCFFTTFPFSH